MIDNRMNFMAERNLVGVAFLMLMLALWATACGASGTPAPALPTAPPSAPTMAPAPPTKSPSAPTSAPVKPANTVPAAAPTAITAALKCTGQDTPAAAAPAATSLPSGLTAAESAYLDQVDALVNRINNSSELRAATLAMQDVTQKYGLTGLFDAVAANQALGPAVSFMSGVTADVSALQPPPGFKGVQDELQGAVNVENTFLKDSQTAVANPSREAMGAVQLQLLNPLALLAVTVDSLNRRSKAGMGLPQVGVDSPLAPDETAYLNQVQALLNRMSNCPELSAGISALGDDLEKLSSTGQLDGKASNEARAAAIRFMNALARDALALQPPTRLQAVQFELIRVVQLYTAGFNDWQPAIVDQKWDKLTDVFFNDVGAATAIVIVLSKDLAFLGIK